MRGAGRVSNGKQCAHVNQERFLSRERDNSFKRFLRVNVWGL